MTPEVAPAPKVTLPWLLRLRWYAVGGQLFTVALVRLGLGLSLPVPALVTCIAATAVTNLALGRWLALGHEASPRLIASVLVLDTLLLTMLLFLAGGPENPFSALYLVHVTLAAVVLGRRWGWTVLALSAACFLLLFVAPVPLAAPAALDVRSLHLRGTWIAFLVAGVVTAAFVSRIADELKAREHELALVQAVAARHEKLASLTTLAAGAAHELGTPLATIAVVARELEHGAERLELGPGVREDLRLIREQVERCRLILVQMSAKAGETAGELPGPLAVEALVTELRSALPAERAARLEVEVGGEIARIEAPRQALVQVLTSLARNAFDASDPAAKVRLVLARAGDRVRFSVVDRGQGMSPEVLSRAGDPFFTTKPTGRGTGLGLFLARAFAERLGGKLLLSSEPGAGTLAALELPQPAARRES